MNQFVYHLVPNLITLVEFVVLTVFEFGKMDFRHNFVIRSIACASLGVFVSVLFTYFETYPLSGFSTYLDILYNAALDLVLIFTCIFLLSASNTTRLFSATVILLGQQSVKVILTLIANVVSSAEIYLDNYVYWIVEIILFALDVFYMYEIFMKNYRGRTEQVSSRFIYIYLTLLVALSFVFEVSFSVLSKKQVRFSLILSVFYFLYIILMTFFLLTTIKQEENNTNISILKQMWNEDKKQYQIQKESMEIINIKCHDLKHRIQNIKEAGISDSKGAKELMNQLESNIDIYDSIIKTGNDVLDVILSNVALRASRKGIQLTSMVDGACLSFLEEGDTYSLFENMLDNAMEYEDTVENKDDCFISLTVKRVNDMAHIHCENYYYGGAEMVNGKLVTKKQDKKNHGYGIRSMEQMAYKYKGQFNVVIADGMFQVDISIPIPKEAK